MRDKVSIIIPLYNGNKYIYETILSVFEQTYSYYEIIIVDDGSIDDSYALIEKWVKDGRVKYHYQKNRGVAEARNTGIRVSSGELIALLDQDDRWLPNKLSLQVEYLQKHPSVGLVHSDIRFINESGIEIPAPSWNWVKNVSGYCLGDLFRVSIPRQSRGLSKS